MTTSTGVTDDDSKVEEEKPAESTDSEVSVGSGEEDYEENDDVVGSSNVDCFRVGDRVVHTLLGPCTIASTRCESSRHGDVRMIMVKFFSCIYYVETELSVALKDLRASNVTPADVKLKLLRGILIHGSFLLNDTFILGGQAH